MYSVDIDYFFGECGYDRVDLLGDLPSMRERSGWIPYQGYFELGASIRPGASRQCAPSSMAWLPVKG